MPATPVLSTFHASTHFICTTPQGKPFMVPILQIMKWNRHQERRPFVWSLTAGRRWNRFRQKSASKISDRDPCAPLHRAWPAEEEGRCWGQRRSEEWWGEWRGQRWLLMVGSKTLSSSPCSSWRILILPLATCLPNLSKAFVSSFVKWGSFLRPFTLISSSLCHIQS